MSPFEVLQIDPTLDRTAVKRAYFARLAQHPPHSDPTGFRTLRRAYESLQGPGLLAAYMRAPLDVERLLAAAMQDLADGPHDDIEAATSAMQRAASIETFEGLLRVPLDQALRRLSEHSGQ